MKKLSKKSIIITVAIVLILAIVIGIILCGKDIHETNKNDSKIEQQETEKADDKAKEENAEQEESEAVETETEMETVTEEQTENNVVEEPKQETTTQQQGSSNTNNNNNNNNSGRGTTTPSTPATTPTPTPEPEKSPYAGMYSQLDAAAKERYSKCVDIFRTGMGSQYIPVRDYGTSTHYWGETIGVCNHTTTGSWMMVTIKGWSGYGVGAETEPIYAEVPTLVKQCFETIAPQGGTELYNTVNSIISQYGSPYDVPTLGTISELIPGLSVTIENVKGVFIMQFWTE